VKMAVEVRAAAIFRRKNEPAGWNYADTLYYLLHRYLECRRCPHDTPRPRYRGEISAARGRQYICSGITAAPPGATMRPQVSSAPTVSSLVRTGRPAICREYLYLPGGNSSVGPFGAVGPPTPAAIL